MILKNQLLKKLLMVLVGDWQFWKCTVILKNQLLKKLLMVLMETLAVIGNAWSVILNKPSSELAKK